MLFLSNVLGTSSIVMSVTGVDLLPVRKSMKGVFVLLIMRKSMNGVLILLILYYYISVEVMCLSFFFTSYD